MFLFMFYFCLYLANVALLVVKQRWVRVFFLLLFFCLPYVEE